ncbi:hypothetical protein ACLBKS_15985 [Hylemonella sp. W303a]|uniref:hypothetical protein n=1 Tax=Hylemonella sp. W303a TaxID=3389873 RepID=UPI00396B0688
MLPAIAALIFLTGALPVYAQATSDISLPNCLADNTSGKDRKDLARWVFFAMGVHPEIKQYLASGAVNAKDEADKAMAGLLTRLMTESCSTQVKAAFKQGGPIAIQSAFQTLGQLAMQELMTDVQVTVSMGAFQNYIDREKLNEMFGRN